MRQRFPRLHDPHAGGFNRDSSVFFDALRVLRVLQARHGDADFQHLTLKLWCRSEAVRRFNGVALRLLLDNLVLAARERVHDPLQDLFGDAQSLPERVERVGRGNFTSSIERQKSHSLEGRDLEVVRLLSPPAPHRSIAQAPDPGKSPFAVLLLVVVAKDLVASRHLRWQVQVHGRKGGPVPGGEHLDREVYLLGTSDLCRVVLFKVLLVVFPNGQVVEHAFHLARELGAAALLQLGDHEPLVII
mmetsp:Transcript_18917/g.55023  ORF Transcript_18917/g.55023 Transcript_18917/m.55023 type:complete len:245 (-) Transcript_18917:1421-2155(-)